MNAYREYMNISTIEDVIALTMLEHPETIRYLSNNFVMQAVECYYNIVDTVEHGRIQPVDIDVYGLVREIFTVDGVHIEFIKANEHVDSRLIPFIHALRTGFKIWF